MVIALAEVPASAATAPTAETTVAVTATGYADLVQADHPAVYYRLGGPTAVDSAGHNVTGTYAGTAVTGVAGAIPADTDTAVRVSDAAPVLQAPAASLPSGAAPRTVEFWFKAAGSGGLTPIFGYGGTTISLADSGEVRVTDNARQERAFALPSRTDDATWHLWDVTYDGTAVTFFQDGQSLGTQPMPIDTTDGGTLQLGAWAGDYDEFAVYPSALSPDRVNARWTRGQNATTACAAAPTDRYGSAILADDPAAYYRLSSEGNRAATDSSGNCRNAALTSFTTGASGAVAGDADASVQVADRRTVLTASANAFPSGASARTVEFWFKADGASGLTPILGYGGTTILLRDTDEVRINDNNSQERAYALPTRIDDNIWHLWDVSYDGANVTFYLDGQSLGTQFMPMSTRAGGGLTLGGWAGAYDELAVYPTALAPGRIAAHWTAGAATTAACATAPTSAYGTAVTADQPTAYYRLGDGGRVAYDYSGHCHNAATASFATGATGGADSDGSTRAADRRIVLTASAAAFPTGASSRTVEFWFKANGASGLTPILRYGGTTISLRDTDEARINDNNSQERAYALPARTDDDTWHLWDVAYDGANLTFYLDGQSLGTQPMPMSTREGGGLWLGGWAGDYDELAVYPAALSPARIGAHWTAGVSPAPACAGVSASDYGKTVVADHPATYYRLDNAGSDRVAYDYSGNCRNGAYGSYVTKSAAGAVNGDQDSAAHIADPRPVLRAPAASLPTGSAARTLEFWFKATGSSGLTPMLRYGGTTISLRDTDEARINDNNSQERAYAVPYRTDDNQWHLWDVTYDGADVAFYLDGQSLGSQPMPMSTREGGALELGGWAGDYDELAVYPAVLAADRIAAHYTAGLIGSNAAITGTITFAGQPVAGALVQACTAAAACVQGRSTRTGSYVLSVAPGAYDLTVFPPATGNGAAARIGSAHADVPDTAARVTTDVTLAVAALPAGSSIESPTVGNQTSGVPTIFWAEPTTYRTTGCPNGLGMLSVAMPDGDNRSFVMAEQPTGSGNYATVIPPLAPLHGDAKVGTSILCRISATPFVPGGGPETGGNNILVHVDSSSPAASFAFGGVAASSFKTEASGVYVVKVPAGTGDVPVSMKFTDGTGRTLDTYHYVAATRVTESGPADAGNQITITGKGFDATTMVLFGERAAEAVTVESPTRLRVTVPPGSGNVAVTVISGGGAVPAGTYGYQGTQSQAKPFVCPEEICTAGRTAIELSYNFAEAYNVGKHFTKTQRLSWANDANAEMLVTATVPYVLGLTDYQRDTLGFLGDMEFIASLIAPEAALAFAPEVLLAVLVVALGMWTYNHREDFKRGALAFFHLLIDPSGTIVDRNGTPVAGATVTLLRQGEDGTYAPVPADSDMIDPHTNPQITGASGAFAWMAAAGSYRVRATAADCPGAVVEDGPYVLPPPAIGLVLTLPCTLPVAARPPSITGIATGGLTSTGGDTVTIYGTNLFGTTAVKFGDRNAASFKVLSPYAISAVTPTGTGTVTVRVTTAGGTGTADVQYLPAPATVTATTTTTTVTAPGAVAYGAAIPLRAKVVSPAGTPTGTVTFTEGATRLGTATLTAGVAALNLSALAIGSHTITVAYAGTADFQPSAGTATVRVSPAGTTMSLTVGSASGQPVTLTAQVTSAAGTPDGAVSFRDGPADLGTARLSASGTATLTTSALAVGAHTLTAAYGGSGLFADSSATAAYTVTAPPVLSHPALALRSTAYRLYAGKPVIFRATATAMPSATRQIRILETAGRTTRVVATCGPVTTCTVTLRHDPGYFRYQAQAVDAAGRPLVTSAALGVTWAAPALTLSTSASSAPSGHAVTLRATTSAGVSGTPYRFVIRDLTTGRVIRTCGTAATCTVPVTNRMGTHRYEATIQTTSGATIARSATAKVLWR